MGWICPGRMPYAAIMKSSRPIVVPAAARTASAATAKAPAPGRQAKQAAALLRDIKRDGEALSLRIRGLLQSLA